MSRIPKGRVLNPAEVESIAANSASLVINSLRNEGWGEPEELIGDLIATARAGAARAAPHLDPETLIPMCLAVCEARGWSLHWTARGAYLHLEASELIEAWRGKGHTTVAQEAGDVLLVLFSILGVADVPWKAALACARAKMEDLQTRPRYAGEEYSASGLDGVPTLAMKRSNDGEKA